MYKMKMMSQSVTELLTDELQELLSAAKKI